MDGSGWIGKKILLIFDDGTAPNRREGTITAFNEAGIILDNKQFFPRERIIRLEVRP